MRITKNILGEKVKYLNYLIKATEGQPNSFELEYAYGGVRLCKRCVGGGYSDLSARVKLVEMAVILDTLEYAILKMELVKKS